MKRRWCMVLLGSLFFVPQVKALTPEDIAKIAESITVFVDGQNPGSGVIIGRRGDTYYVLTAKHVVGTEDEYAVVAPDGQRYRLNYQTVRKLPKLDLAVFEFTTSHPYNIAAIGDSDRLTTGNSVYIYGFPGGEFTGAPGTFSGITSKLSNGYTLKYAVATVPGMSGGPILNDNGRLVGIHGQGAVI